MGLSWSDFDPGKYTRQAASEIKKQTDSIGRAINKSAISIGHSAEVNWANADRGEIGKFVSQQGQAQINKNLALPRAIITGQWNKEGQRFVGSNMVTATPIESYLGNNKSVVRNMNDENWNKNTLGILGNFGNSWHGTNTAAQEGKVSNADRNDMWQGMTKAAAAVAIYFGGSAAYGAMGGTSAGTAGGVGAVEVAGGTPYTAAAVTSTDIAVGSGSAAAAGSGAAAAGGTSWASYATAAGIGLNALTGKGGSPNSFDFGTTDTGEGTGDIWDSIGGIIRDVTGGNKSPGPSGIDYSSLVPNDNSGYAETVAPAAAGISLIAVAAVIGGVYFARKAKVF